ncbi:MAG: hypothetical protein ACR2Q4_17990 [Geminicoccaceae bacterium]
MAELPFNDTIWQSEDADWERWQLAGWDALAEGDDERAGKSFSKALQVARQGFAPGDPRLASSLANHAAMLAKRDDPVAERLFREALQQWQLAKDWLARQPMPRRARSSMFHLRLEAKHPGAYRSNTHQRCLSLVEEGRARTSALIEGGVGSDATINQPWRPDRNDGFDLLRKITAAVKLIVHH